MQNFKAVLDGTNAYLNNQRGTVLLIQTADQGNGLTVQLLRGGAVIDTVSGVGPAYKLVPVGGFDSFAIQGAAGNVTGVVTMGDIDIQLSQLNATVANSPANPVPVKLVNPGDTTADPINVQVTNAQLTVSSVGVNNTTANPVPVQQMPGCATITDSGAVAVGTAGAQLIAAGARKVLRVRNAGTGKLALTGAAATTFANAAIVLQPGDVWNETDAPHLQWFAVSDVGSTANVQVLA